MGGLGRAPFGLGTRCIDFLGHMTPPSCLQTRLLNGMVRGPIGASCWFDGDGAAVEAWSRFGFGLVELGPCWVGEDGKPAEHARDHASASVRVRPRDGPLDPARVKAKAAQAAQAGLGTLARLQPPRAMEPEALAWQTHRTMDALDPALPGFVLDTRPASASWTREH